MVKTGVTVNVNKVPEVLAALRFLSTNRVMVGIPSTKNEREDDDGNPTEIGNAAIGFIQENGDPEMNLPARPWLKPGVAAVNDKTTALLKVAGNAVLSGDRKKAEAQYNAVGLSAQIAVQRYLRNSSNFAPLSERTLEARRKRGRTGTKPLIDSAQLLQHVSYVIAKIRALF